MRRQRTRPELYTSSEPLASFPSTRVERQLSPVAASQDEASTPFITPEPREDREPTTVL